MKPLTGGVESLTAIWPSASSKQIRRRADEACRDVERFVRPWAVRPPSLTGGEVRRVVDAGCERKSGATMCWTTLRNMTWCGRSGMGRGCGPSRVEGDRLCSSAAAFDWMRSTVLPWVRSDYTHEGQGSPAAAHGMMVGFRWRCAAAIGSSSIRRSPAR